METPFNKNRNSRLKADFMNVLPPEHKTLAPDRSPCNRDPREILQRMHVIATRLILMGKETDRKSDEGGDLSFITFQPSTLRERKGQASRSNQYRATDSPANEGSRTNGKGDHTL